MSSKLNKTQISAIANKIVREINEKRQEKRIKISQKKNRFLDSKTPKNPIITELRETLRGDYLSSHLDSCLRKYVSLKYENELKEIESELKKYNSISFNTVYEDIIIETIGAENIETIIQKIKRKYT